MKKAIYLVIAIVLCLGNLGKVKAQDHELGVALGAAEYLGDLSYTHVTWSNTKYNLGGMYRYYFNPKFNFRGTVLYGQIQGSDADKPQIDGAAYTRNLSFYSHLLEFAGQIEYNILPFISGNKLRFWSPYVFAGVAVYNFNPKVDFNGTTYELQKIGTSGQGLPGYGPKYRLTQVAVPYGFGLKFSFRRPNSSQKLNMYLWNIGIFVQQNKLFTDMLDDVGGVYPDFSLMDPIAVQLSDREGSFDSQGNYVPVRQVGSNRGNPNANDSYMWLGFNITKTLRKNTCFCF